MMPKAKLEKLQKEMERRHQKPWRWRRLRLKVIEPPTFMRINTELMTAVMELVPAKARAEFAYCLAKKILDDSKQNSSN